VDLVHRRADAVDQWRQRADVDPVDLGRVEPEDPAGLVLGHVPEPLTDPVAGVREGALGVREVVAPHDVADPDGVAALDVVLSRGGGGEEAVAVQVVAGLHGDGVAERRAELAGVVAADPLLVHLPDDVGDPPGAVLRHGVPQRRVALEDPGPDQHVQNGPGRPPPASLA
jgi:hypothetical protein